MLNTALFILVHLLLSMLAFVFIMAVIVFAIRRTARKYRWADLSIFTRLEPIVSERNNRIMQGLTYFGKHKFLIPANLVLIAYFIFFRHQNWSAVRTWSVSLSSLTLMFVLKYLFHRKRPLAPLLDSARGLSFPSGHAIMSASFFGLLIYFIHESTWPYGLQLTCSVLLVLFILLIGFSRIYLRVHYASDVIIGFIVGLAWLLISLGVMNAAEHLRY